MKRIFLSIILGLSFHAQVFAAGTRVGNGNDGSDLNQLKPVTNGILIETRDLALAQLEKINVQGIPHLGTLKKEVKSSDIYLASKDLKNLKSKDGEGIFYAKTYPEAHADTIFSPSALKLSKDELITLHIHEALHRTLPKEVREDEALVSSIAMSITAPGASFDRVRKQTETIAGPIKINRNIENTLPTKSKPHSIEVGFGGGFSTSNLIAFKKINVRWSAGFGLGKIDFSEFSAIARYGYEYTKSTCILVLDCMSRYEWSFAGGKEGEMIATSESPNSDKTYRYKIGASPFASLSWGVSSFFRSNVTTSLRIGFKTLLSKRSIEYLEDEPIDPADRKAIEDTPALFLAYSIGYQF